MNYTKEELIEIEKQLSKPEGENGVTMAENMNETNIKVIIDSIDFLNPNEADKLLEIGHGNCSHLEKIYENKNSIEYFGLEISKTMKTEAERINHNLIQNHQINFSLYDGEKIPFQNNYLDKIFTVNTIYFWKNPSNFIAEIHRVLKTNGILVIGYAQKEFMKKLPFVNSVFSLYNTEDINELFKNSGLQIIDHITKSDVVSSKLGEKVERTYSIVKVQKL